MYLPTYARSTLRGLSGWGPLPGMSADPRNGPPGDAYTYDGPLFPQVIDNGDGTRTIRYNPEQSATCPVKPTADPEVPVTPGMAPKQGAGAPEGWYVLAKAQGKVVQGPLSAQGLIMGPSQIVQLPVDCRPNEHPTIGFGGSSEPEFDPYDYCSPSGPTWASTPTPVYDPLTGQRLEDIYAAPSGCDSPSGWVTATGAKIARCDAPFTGGAAFWGNVQGPASGDPTYGMVGVDPCAVSPGTNGYEKGTPFAPYAPWWDKDSKWYGHPVLNLPNLEQIYDPTTDPEEPGDFPEDEPEPGDPLPPPYYPPCRPCDTAALGPDPVTGETTVLCFPDPNCTGQPPEEEPCVVGYSMTAPFGPIYDRDCLGIGTEPDPWDPGTPPGNGNGGPTNGGGPGAGPATGRPSWLALGATGLVLFLLMNQEKRRENPSVPRGRFATGDVVQVRSADPNLNGRLAVVVGTAPTRDDSVRVKLLGKVGGTFSGDESQFKLIARA